MKFGISREEDSEARNSSHEVQEFVNKLSDFIESIDYGSGVEHFTVGLVVIKSRPGYEDWFKQRKPQFKKAQKVKGLDGCSTFELKNYYSYDIKLADDEIDEFVKSGKLAIKIFCKRFIESLSNFESPSMKKRDFDLAKFRRDVIQFVDERINA